MVAIVLGILKIIGILLLVVLGLILFGVLSVLFVPVRYRAEGSVYESLKAKASVSWFLDLISMKVSYDGEMQTDLRILWFHPGRETNEEDADQAESSRTECGMDEAEAVKENTAGPETGKPDLKDELAERVETAEVKPETEQVKTERLESGKACEAEVPPETAKTEAAVQKPETGEVPGISETRETEISDDADSKPKKPRFRLSAIPERIRRGIAGLKARIHRILQRLKGIAEKFRQGKAQWETIRAFIRDEENKKAFRLAKKQIFAVIRHVLPRKLEGKLHFGFDDPYTTGQVLTWISPFYGLYGRHVQVIPDFLEPCLEGELKLKGRIRLGTLLFLVFWMLQNKQIRLWIRKWRES